MTEAVEWIRANDTLLWWLAAGSALLLLSSLVVVPWTLAVIPADHFSHRTRTNPQWAGRHPAAWILFLVIKNAVGLLLVVVGILLLFLPGQGILSIIAGVELMNIPGKYRLVRWLIRRPVVLRSINWLRRRAGRDPLIVDE